MMAGKKKGDGKQDRKVTRYTYDDVTEPRTPETGHTSLLPADELTLTLPMDNGWSKKIQIGHLPNDDERPIVIDMDPDQDPLLFWSGKRNRRDIPVLPLQRNEIVSESRISQIIDRARAGSTQQAPTTSQGQLFAELERTLRETEKAQRVEFYTHDEGWRNKLICGDSMHVIESLIHYENLRGKVQMVYVDPPYGIKYDSNFQQRVDSTNNDEKDRADDILTIKAFRDTWSLGIHTYLSYLQERLYLCRELLTDTGSIFVQISEDNVHLVRALMDEVFGSRNFCSLITFQKTTSQTGTLLSTVSDYLLWYARDAKQVKFRQLYSSKVLGEAGSKEYTQVEEATGAIRRATDDEIDDPSTLPAGARIFSTDSIVSEGGSDQGSQDIHFPKEGVTLSCGENRHWKVGVAGVRRLWDIGRLIKRPGLRIYKRYFNDFPYIPLTNNWSGLRGEPEKWYVVQTSVRAVERCMLLTTDPGDLVLDPTCGSGTTAVTAEKWGRRWITCDTSRVAVNVARTRLLSSTFDHFEVRNRKVAEGFEYERATRVTQDSLAKDLEPDSVELVDRPKRDPQAVRICGPFEVMSIGRYSIADWQGYIRDSGALSNYVEVICRLYRRNAAIQGAGGLVHAIAEAEGERIAVSVGPVGGRVTGKQINDAVQDALASGLLEVHVLGWAFEANVGEVKSQLERRGKVRIELIMIRPDTLAEGLKITNAEMLFSPLALPDIDVQVDTTRSDHREARVTLRGVAMFDRKSRATDYKAADSGYVSAWYLDEDYDGDCFVDCQMFFDFKKAPNLKATLRVNIDPEEFKLKTVSQTFPLRGYKRIAVKVVDVFGNESTVVKDLA